MNFVFPLQYYILSILRPNGQTGVFNILEIKQRFFRILRAWEQKIFP